MDNATFHRSSLTKTLIEDAGATLIYQPKYSPDMNKSEPQWANLKHYIQSDNTNATFIQKLDDNIINMSNHKVS
jgi:transposase